MNRRRFLLIAGAALLLILVPCNIPPDELAEGCVSPPETSDVTMRWYDSGALVHIPAGEFLMGVPGGEDNPQHQILLDDFWIHKTEVTNGMYAACVAAGGCSIPGPDASLPDFNDPTLKDHPVVGVTWAQADTYCKWIQGRLPTEAEWERAGGGTDGRQFPWGAEEPDCDRINFQKCVRELTHVLDHPDGASPSGGLDFSGNAFEWAGDWYKASYYLESPVQNPPGPASGDVRVLRGGSFESTTNDVRLPTRFSDDPLAVRADLGFRCVVLDPQSFSPPCEIPATVGQPYTPRHAPERAETGCDPPPVDVRVEQYCQDKYPYANITPNGAEITLPEGADCHTEGDLIACTGEADTSFEIQACTSCIPPTPEPPPDQPPSCPPGYTLDETNCVCIFVASTEGYCTTCPSAFSMLYVPAQECCEAQPPDIALGLTAPRCDPGYAPRDCTCHAMVQYLRADVTECETYTVALPSCGSQRRIQPEEQSCAEQACPQGTSWDSNLCCCAVRGKCK